jgi:hypothetical protein
VAEEAKQGKKQGAVSPITGAPVPEAQTWKPGQSGNPQGFSAKARARAALEKLFTDEIADGHFTTLFAVAADKDHPQYAQAVAKLHAVLGLTDVAAQQIVLSTRLELEDRRDGGAKVHFSQQAESKIQPHTGEGESVEIEV